MIVLGKPLAEAILLDIYDTAKAKNLTPCLAVILAGDNPSSRIYVKHKTIAAQEAGIQVNLYEFNDNQNQQAMQKIEELNKYTSTHGIIVQLPVYEGWDKESIINSVVPQKDVDGFLPGSPYTPATAAGVWEMISEFSRLEGFSNAEDFLKQKKIAVLGKGHTAGKPILNLLVQKGYNPTLIDSKTSNADQIIQDSDLVISATGKKNIINGSNIKDNAYVITVGVGKENINGKERIYGDINEDEIKEVAKLYCPTIGGIGPLTIACLLRNVVQSTIINI